MEQKQKRWPAPLDHVYILCDEAREPTRASYLRGWLRENRIDPTCYTFMCKTYGTTLNPAEAMAHYDPHLTRLPVEQQQSPLHGNLRISEVSLLLNWHDLAVRASKEGHRCVMTMESDVRFPPSFLADLAAAFSFAPDCDFLSITSPPHLRPRREPGDVGMRWFVNKGYIKTRTCDAMIFKAPLLKKITESFFPCADVLDWELNYHLQLHEATCGWLDPPILFQGSCGGEHGVYETTLV